MEPKINCSKCNTDYIRRKLRCPSCNKIGISKLFKYVPYSERSLSILINKEIWCPKAKSLNDPFEFHFHLTQDNINGIPIDKTSLENAIEGAKENAVICFSEVNDNILMWSHYAQGHTGFCIEFDRNEKNELGKWEYCVPVSYNIDNNVLSFTLNQLTESETFAKIATSKSLLWEYEKEWRLLVRHDLSNKLIPLPAQISRIIFGCNMDNNKRVTISRILGPAMKYAEAVKESKKFTLKINSIEYKDISM